MKKNLLIPALCSICAMLVSCGGNSGNLNAESTDNSTENAQTMPDWEITARVKKTLMIDGSLSASARMTSVTTNNGVVTLTGTVANKEERSKVVAMVKGVSGVVSVDDQLTVANS